MTARLSPQAEVEAAERRILERRAALRRRGTALALRARRGLASPVAVLAAAGAGWVLGSRPGRRGLLKAFSLLQVALAALAAVKA